MLWIMGLGIGACDAVDTPVGTYDSASSPNSLTLNSPSGHTGTLPEDLDGDGVVAPEDCDDTDASVFPGAPEVCDGVDQDCDDVIDNGVQITFYVDRDQDGFGDAETSVEACDAPLGHVDDATDCDDDDAQIHPDAVEVCNGFDDNCNNQVDDDDPFIDVTSQFHWYNDSDGDGYGVLPMVATQCDPPSPNVVLNFEDCEDTDKAVHPGAAELCNRVDDNCDQLIDDADPSMDPAEQTLWFADNDLDGAGDPQVTMLACFQPWLFTSDASDCDDTDPTVLPGAPEQCNGIDDDCDAKVDEDCP